MAGIHITDIEAAINYWREQKPSPDGVTLAPEIRALAEVIDLELAPEELRLEMTLDLVLIEATFRDDRRTLLDVDEPRIERIEDEGGEADSDGRQLGIEVRHDSIGFWVGLGVG